MLADIDYRLILNFALLGLLLVLALLGKLIQKIKDRQQQERGEQQEWQYQHRPDQTRQADPMQQPPPARPATRPGSVEEIVQVMREAAQRRAAGQKPPASPPPQAIPTLQPVRPQPAQQQRPLSQRHLAPTATGAGVDQETTRLRRHVQQEEQKRTLRLGRRHPGQLEVAPDMDDVVPVEPAAITRLDAAEARRAVVYSEILGQPLALRRQRAMWEG